MARADLLISLVQTGADGDAPMFRKTVEAIVAEERSKKHYALAERLTNILKQSLPSGAAIPTSDPNLQNAFYEIKPKRGLESLILSKEVDAECKALVEEYHRRDLLRTYNLEPKHRVLLAGPPGNGKTSLAEALAYELMVPMFVVRYEGIVGSYLGDTAKQLDRLFEHIKQQRCVLFFDEFDALSKERNDLNEVGEIKRVVNSLLLQLDSLPSHVMFIGATNHADMLDRAAWRRFQMQLELKKPTKTMAAKWVKGFMVGLDHDFGYEPEFLAAELSALSFAELEQFALDVQRQYVLNLPSSNIKKITSARLKQWKSRSKPAK